MFGSRSSAALAAFLGLVLASPVRADDASDRLEPLLRVATDENEKLEVREEALGKARFLLMPTPAVRSLVESSIPGLLESLAKKIGDKKYEKLTSFAFTALEPLQPYSDIARIARPFVAKGSPALQQAAINSVKAHGATGAIRNELLAIVDAVGQGDTERARLLSSPVLAAAKASPRADALALFLAILEKWQTPDARRASVRGLGEIGDPKAVPSLAKLAAATEPSVELECEAAAALVRCGSWEGEGELLRRFEGLASGTIYRELCTAAFLVPEGFDSVPPAKTGYISSSKHDELMELARKWWETVKKKTVEEVVFERLAEKDAQVPRDRKSKEAITALISGLASPSRPLRYAVLDLLVRKTNFGASVAADFKMLDEKSGGFVTRREEPPDGFTSSKDAEELFLQQKRRAEALLTWWEAHRDKATLEKGVWTVAPDR